MCHFDGSSAIATSALEFQKILVTQVSFQGHPSQYDFSPLEVQRHWETLVGSRANHCNRKGDPKEIPDLDYSLSPKLVQ
jgi:hypothetical protein